MEMAKPLMNFWFQIKVGNHFRPYSGLKLAFLVAGWVDTFQNKVVNVLFELVCWHEMLRCWMLFLE